MPDLPRALKSVRQTNSQSVISGRPQSAVQRRNTQNSVSVALGQMKRGSQGGGRKSLNQSTLQGRLSTLVQSALGQSSQKLLTDVSTLPETFDLEKVEKLKSPVCTLCNRKYGLLVLSEHHCKRCGRSVCADCSESKRVLSKQDEKFYRVCDSCDTKMQNFKLENMLKTIHELKENSIVTLRGRIELLDEQVADAESKSKAEEARLEELERHMERRRKDLEVKKSLLEDEKQR